jgi:hypothetical protein
LAAQNLEGTDVGSFAAKESYESYSPVTGDSPILCRTPVRGRFLQRV